MQNHQIKINRASKLVSFLPMAEREIMDSIHPELIATLTAAEIATVKQSLNRHWHKAVSHANREVVADGYVWSDKHNALLDVVLPRSDA